MKEKVSRYLLERQDIIYTHLEKQFNCKFEREDWKRERGGGGLTISLNNHDILEKAGINTSIVYGDLEINEQRLFKSMLDSKGIQIKDTLENSHFYATGLSIVIHPNSPQAPTVHCNYRYFELTTKSEKIAWFGGGADLTPSYYYKEDEQHFHQTYEDCCNRYDKSCYQEFKEACNHYFYLPHRNEYRGVGGIFFDYLKKPSLDQCFDFIKDCSEHFLPSYLPILKKRHTSKYSQSEKIWQSIRRGRYVEFNLLYDKGTLFGFKTKGRTESILMSMPPQVKWNENYKVIPSSQESKMLKRLEYVKTK